MTLPVLLIAAYFAVLAALSLAAMPYRRRMRRLGVELCELELNEAEKGIVEGLLNNAYSWRASILVTFAYLEGIFQSNQAVVHEVEGVNHALPKLVADNRFFALVEAYVASVVGINPVIGMFALLARMVFRLRVRARASANEAHRATDLRAASVSV